MAESPNRSGVDGQPTICRGNLYWADTPYHAEDPVSVFHPHPLDERVGIVSPDPSLFDSGEEWPVVVKFKRRPVLVLQNDAGNRSTKFCYTIVALGYSFDKKEMGSPFYNDVVNWRTQFLIPVRAGLINEREGYINLGNLLLVHKSMIKDQITEDCPFTPEQWRKVEQGLRSQFALPLVKEPVPLRLRQSEGIGMPKQPGQ